MSEDDVRVELLDSGGTKTRLLDTGGVSVELLDGGGVSTEVLEPSPDHDEKETGPP